MDSNRDATPAAPPPSRSRRWLARLLRGLVALFLVVVFLAASLGLALHLPAVQQTVLGFVSTAVEDGLGFSISADRIRLDLRRGAVGLDGLALVATGAPRPFATAEEVDLRIQWGSLFGDRVKVPSVKISGLRADVGESLPTPPPSGEPSAGMERGVDIDRIDVSSVKVIGPIPGDGATWLRSWSLTEGSVTGSFVGDLFEAVVTSRVLVEARWPGTERDDRWTGALELSLSAGLDGDFELPRAALHGEGVELAVAGGGRLEPTELDASVEARIEPSRWWPAADELGTLEAVGTVELHSGTLGGNLALRSEALAGELLDPWLAEVGLEGLATAGTRIEADADLRLAVDLSGDDPQADLLRGRVEAEWRRGEEVLLAAEARAEEPVSLDPEAAAQLTVAAALRPEGVDRVEVSGDLLLASWTRLEDTEMRDLRVGLEVADVDSFLAGLWVPPESVETWLPAGALTASADAQGPVRAPFANAEVQWTVGGERVLSATAARPPGSSSNEPLRIEATVLPTLPGRRELEARIAMGKPEWPFTLTADLAHPELSAMLDELTGRWPELFPRSPEALADLDRPEVRTIARGSLTARLEAGGSWRHPFADLTVDWRPDDTRRSLLTAIADLGWESPFVQPGAQGELTFENIDLAEWQWDAEEAAAVLSGRVSGRLALGLDEDGRLQGSTDLDLADLALGETPWLEHASLEASLAKDELVIAGVSGRLAFPSPVLEDARFEGSGLLAITPEGEGELTVRFHTPAAAVTVSTADLALADGVAVLRARAEGQPGEAVIEAPLGSIADILGDRVPPAWSESLPRGPLRASIDTPSIGSWSALFLPTDSGMALAGALHGALEVDASRPMGADGEIVLRDISVVSAEGQSLTATEPVRVRVGEGRLELERAELRTGWGGTFVASGGANLDEGWKFGDPWADLLDQVALDAEGTLDASILNPLLVGGIASGPMTLEIDASDRSGSLVLDLNLDAPDGTLVFPTGYISRISSPRFRLRIRDGAIELQDGEMVLNRGTVRLNGRYNKAEGIRLGAAFEGVRYRVDYGLNLILEGRLQFNKRPSRAAVISGRAVVGRGALRRDIFLDRELLRSFSLGDATAATESALDQVELDLVITTREGIQITNNIADLRLDWDNLLVSGTVGEPLVAGRIDSDPGGWLEALGQLFRIDNLAIELFDDPSAEPVFEIETTSLLDDPTLYQQRREGVWAAGMNADSPQNDLFFREQQHSSEAAMAQFTSGLATHFGDRLARTLGQGAMMQFSVQPLPLYGETSTDGRFTLTQRLGMYATFISSNDTRQSEAVTYILEMAELLPKTTIQLFTSDAKNEGATAQIITPLIRNDPSAGRIPRLGEIEWVLPETVKRRRLRRAMTFRKGDPSPEGSDFDVEIDVVEALQSLGFPGSTVTVTPSPVERGRVDLAIVVDAGPHVESSFEGLRIPVGFRDLITAEYLPSELDRGASLEAVQLETERTLRRLGHLGPSAVVTEEAIEGLPFEQHRLLRVITTAERQIELEEVRFEGLPEEDALALIADYDSVLSRLELAEALPGADRLLLRRASTLGYPDARIVERRLSEVGDELVVVIEHGGRERIASFRVEGLPADHRDLAEALSISPGDPAHRRELTSQGRAIVTGLRRRGFMRADLDLSVEPTEGQPELVEVVFTVIAGPRIELAGVDFRGFEHTKRSFLESLVETEPGKPLTADTIGRARRNLFRTTLFEGIDTALELSDGSLLADKDDTAFAPGDDEAHPVTTVFEVEEGPRFLVSYGGRWETTKGASIIGDFIDRNFRGIGQTLGIRAVYGESERRLRLYYGLPRTPFPESTMEIFLEGSSEDRSLELCDAPEGLLPIECQQTREQGGDPPNVVLLDVDELTARFQLTFPLSPTTQARPFLTLTERDVTVIDGEDELSAQLPSGDANDVLDRVFSPALGIQISHDTRQGSTTGGLSEGLFAGLQLTGSHEALGSDLSALEVIGEAKLFKQVATWRQQPVVWAQRYRLGAQLTPSDERVPVFDQYFAGGEYSLRGYPTESFGPGQAQLVINQELHFPIWSMITGLVFFDTGNIWDTVDALQDDLELFSTVGVGLRFSAFRLDFAVPLDQRLNDPDYQVYFGFGNAF